MSVCSVLSPVDAFVCSPNIWGKKINRLHSKIKGVAFSRCDIHILCGNAATPNQKYILFMRIFCAKCVKAMIEETFSSQSWLHSSGRSSKVHYRVSARN